MHGMLQQCGTQLPQLQSHTANQQFLALLLMVHLPRPCGQQHLFHCHLIVLSCWSDDDELLAF